MTGCTCQHSPWNQTNIFICNNTNLRTFPELVPNSTDWVIVTRNNLHNLQNVCPCLKNVKYIDMSFNNINFISDQAMMALLNNTSHLNLQNNNLQYLPKSITKADASTELLLSGNPYKCGCHMIWMRNWLVEHKNIHDYKDIVCVHGRMKGILSMWNLINTKNFRYLREFHRFLIEVL